MIDFIVDNSKIDENGDLVRMCIQSLPLKVLWDVGIVKRAVDTASQLLSNNIIVSDFFGLVFDDGMEMRGRTIGSIGAFELMLKDKSGEMLKSCGEDRMLFELYLRINKYATSEIERQKKDDEELLG